MPTELKVTKLIGAIVLAVFLRPAHAQVTLPQTPVVAVATEEPDPPIWDEQKPMSPGLHHLKYTFEYEGIRRQMTYVLYLPPQIDDATAGKGELPLVLFLVGKGSRGNTMEMALREGPLLAMKRSEEFAKTVDYAVLIPQVPHGKQWETAEMGTFVAQTTRRVLERWPIDKKRVYLTGKSMGGEGVYHAAMAGPDLYAVVACVSGRQHPDPALVARTLKGTTMFIAVGELDLDFTRGSQVMADAFKKEQVDLAHVVIPNRAHDVWMFYMLQPKFYTWMLKHRRGEAPPKDRATMEELRYFASKPPNEKYQKFSEDLQKQFSKFRPWWFVENSAMVQGVGLHDGKLGLPTMFLTYPLNRKTPCRIMHTAKIPQGKRTVLELEVAHAPKGRWELMVNVESKRKLHTAVHENRDAPNGWRTYRIDLTEFAGKKAFIEVLNMPWGWGKVDTNATAYWKRIEIKHYDLPKQPEPKDEPAADETITLDEAME